MDENKEGMVDEAGKPVRDYCGPEVVELKDLCHHVRREHVDNHHHRHHILGKWLWPHQFLHFRVLVCRRRLNEIVKSSSNANINLYFKCIH